MSTTTDYPSEDQPGTGQPDPPPTMLATISPWNLPIGLFEVPGRGGTLFGTRW